MTGESDQRSQRRRWVNNDGVEGGNGKEGWGGATSAKRELRQNYLEKSKENSAVTGLGANQSPPVSYIYTLQTYRSKNGLVITQ